MVVLMAFAADVAICLSLHLCMRDEAEDSC